MRSLLAGLLDVAFPAHCAGCDLEGAVLCTACEPQLDERLMLPPGMPIGLPGVLPAHIVQLEWCAPFGGTVRRALHELKYGAEQRLAEPLGRALARRWARAGRGGDVLVPVPVHAKRLRVRGYDQAELLARVAGRELGLPVAPIVERTRSTVAQYDLDRPERAGNVRGAFAVRRGSEPGTRRLSGRWIVLVDDVVTTGSTLSACARPLLQAGAEGVSAITLARER